MSAIALDQQVNDRVNAALWDNAMTQQVVIAAGALDMVSNSFRTCFGDATAVVVADENTFAAAGQSVSRLIHAAGIESAEAIVLTGSNIYAEYLHVEQLRRQFSAASTIAIAVGSGTINDLVKLAAGECKRPYMSVATAASMDGYTSFGASVTKDGYKQTLPCPAPLAVIVDLNVLADAPPRLNAAGYADLLAKIPAGADWLIADALGVEPIVPLAWSLVQDRLRDWLRDPAAIRRGDRTALAGLIEGLIMTGLGMQFAGTTRPASGAEHQFSHLWDMQNHKVDGAAPMHGEKVGIGSIAIAALYERVMELDASSIEHDADRLRQRWPTWEAIETLTRRSFDDPELADQIVEQQRAKYVSVEELQARLSRLSSTWIDLVSRLREQLFSANETSRLLAEVGAPHAPEAIGISRERLRVSYGLAQQIRSRYTVLDLVYQAGWWNDCIKTLFGPQGHWK